MTHVVDTAGQVSPATLRITLRADTTGVSLGAVDLAPGETADVPTWLGRQLIALGKATPARDATASVPPAPQPTPAGVVETRDPAPRRRR